MGRNYKDEYEKFQSSKKMKKKRAKLNKINRDKGTYGNRDGLDVSHMRSGGKIILEDESTNRGRKEKSRLQGSKRKKYQDGGLLKGKSHAEGGIPILAEGEEIMINKTMNNAAGIHQDELLALNESPEDYMIVPKDEFPVSNAMERSESYPMAKLGGKVKSPTAPSLPQYKKGGKT